MMFDFRTFKMLNIKRMTNKQVCSHKINASVKFEEVREILSVQYQNKDHRKYRLFSLHFDKSLHLCK